MLRAVKFSPSTAQNHCNDILPMLLGQVKDGKGVAFIKVDNGADWNLANVVNELFFARLFRDSGLFFCIGKFFYALLTVTFGVKHN